MCIRAQSHPRVAARAEHGTAQPTTRLSFARAFRDFRRTWAYRLDLRYRTTTPIAVAASTATGIPIVAAFGELDEPPPGESACPVTVNCSFFVVVIPKLSVTQAQTTYAPG